MKSLVSLDIYTQKDQIIARLILQKANMYVDYTEKWLDGFLSKKEAFHVHRYTVDEDKKEYHSAYEEIARYIDEGFWGSETC